VNLPFAINAKRLPLMLAVGALGLGIAGCGVEHRTVLKNVSQDELSAGGEPYFNAGQMTYQIEVSRQLNPYNAVDAQYLSGLSGAQDISAQQFWFGVFIWAKNQTNRDVTTTDHFELQDSQGDIFQQVALNPSVNPYAWTAQTLAPDGIEPAAGSTASNGNNGGALVLFELTQSVYSNRPLTLLVFKPGATTPSSRVSLDL
jgi:hypothetical protein